MRKTESGITVGIALFHFSGYAIATLTHFKMPGKAIPLFNAFKAHPTPKASLAR